MIERHGVRQITGKAAAHIHVDAQFLTPPGQQRFHLRVALKAFRHPGHVLTDALRAPEIAVAAQILVRLPELLLSVLPVLLLVPELLLLR